MSLSRFYSTSKVMSFLQKKSDSIRKSATSAYQTFTGTLNPHIPHLKGDPLTGQMLPSLTYSTGIAGIAERLAEMAGVSMRLTGTHASKNTGAAMAYVGTTPLVFLGTPSLLQQVTFNRHNLIKGEAGGVQGKFIGEGTPISLSEDDPRYKPQRNAFVTHLSASISKLAGPMHVAMKPFSQEIKDSKGEEVDVGNLSARVALGMVSNLLVGFKQERFSTDSQNKIIKSVHEVTTAAPHVTTLALISAETKMKNIAKTVHQHVKAASSVLKENEACGDLVKTVDGKIEQAIKDFSLTPHVDKWVKMGEDELKKVIKDNEDDTFEKMKLFLGEKEQEEKLQADYKKLEEQRDTEEYAEKLKSLQDKEAKFIKDKLKREDLYKPKIMTLLKLILAGGFETTTKLLTFASLMLADEKNQTFVQAMREDIEKLGKNPDEWTREDAMSLVRLRAFVYEVLRLYPAFSLNRFIADQDFYIAQNLPFFNSAHENNEENYKKAFNDPERDRSSDIFIPKGSILVTSPFDAHRHPTYGKNAEGFDPEQHWIDPKTGQIKEGYSLDDMRKRFDLFTFGNDPRQCPGRRFSELEALLFVAKIIVGYDVKPVNFPKFDVGFTLELAPGETAKVRFVPRDLELKKTLGNTQDAEQGNRNILRQR